MWSSFPCCVLNSSHFRTCYEIQLTKAKKIAQTSQLTVRELLGDDDLIIIKIIVIKMIMIIDKILIKCLGRSPPLVHAFFDGKYNSVLERRPILKLA